LRDARTVEGAQRLRLEVGVDRQDEVGDDHHGAEREQIVLTSGQLELRRDGSAVTLKA